MSSIDPILSGAVQNFGSGSIRIISMYGEEPINAVDEMVDAPTIIMGNTGLVIG